MSTIQLDPEIEQRLESLAARTGLSTYDHIREAVLAYLDDFEDIAIARDRLAHPGRRWTLEEVERELGLDDRVRPVALSGRQLPRHLQHRA